MPSKSPSKFSKSLETKIELSISRTVRYLRVSTNEQELGKNKSDILHLANHLNLGKVVFVEEIVSGKVSWKKRKIADIIEALLQNGATQKFMAQKYGMTETNLHKRLKKNSYGRKDF